jgi:type I restriction enzyme S subunit
VRGADGTQVLKPRAGIDALFFYYACRAIDLPGRGYNRHFSILKEKAIPIPPRAEQTDIGAVMRRVEDRLFAQADLLGNLEGLKRAAMREFFTSGLRGEVKKETGIGPVPQSWEVDRLDRFANVVSTRMSYSELEQFEPTEDDDRVKVLGIKVGDMNRPGNEVGLHHAELERTVPRAVAEYRCAPPRTIIFPKRGAAIATNKKRISYEWTAFDPNVIGIVSKDKVDQEYLFQWFQGFDLRTITEPGPTPQLNKKNLEPVTVPVPQTLEEQREIVAILKAIDRKIDLHKRKRTLLEDLFKALLQKLMSGEVRVADLDRSVLDHPGDRIDAGGASAKRPEAITT